MLDINETLLPGFPRAECASQFLKPLSMSRLPKYSSYRITAPLVQSFALASGTLWRPVDLNGSESSLAAHLGSKEIRTEEQQGRPRTSRRKTELGPAEAEAAAVAISRAWTFLTDDRAAVELLGRLYPEVRTQGTCALLVQAAKRGIVTCSDAAALFNRRIVDRLHFWAFRTSDGKRERLWLRCNPLRCSWEQTLR